MRSKATKTKRVWGSMSLRIAVIGLVFAAVPAGADECYWRPGEGVPGVDGSVYAATLWDPDGPGPEPELLVVGGQFTVAGGVAANNIAAWDGSNWRPLGAGMFSDEAWTDASVSALAVYNGELIAGGRFSSAGGTACSNIARWDGSTWRPLGGGMSPGYTNTGVFALTLYNGDLVAGGDFTLFAGGPECGVARWDGSNWHSVGLGIYGGYVLDLTVYFGELIAAGTFRYAGGVRCDRVARWDGSAWQGLGSGFNADDPAQNHYVSSLALYQGELIAGGYFTAAGAVTCDNIARWDGRDWQPLGSGMQGDSSRVLALTVYDDQLIAGGIFTHAGDVPCLHVARWSGTAWQSLGVGVGAGEAYPMVKVLAVYGGELMVGGDFMTAGDVPCRGIAWWDGRTWRASPELGMNGGVWTLAVHNGELIAGGSFTTAGGDRCRRIARWDDTAWRPLGAGMVSAVGHAQVFALAVYDGELIAGGAFTSAGGAECSNIARWDGSTWQPVGTGIQGSVVYALTIYNGELIAAGVFDAASNVPCANIARWDGNSWQPLGLGLSGGEYSANVRALTVYNGELIAGGVFTTAGGTACNHIARWDGSTWRPLGSGMSGGAWGAEVIGLTVYEDSLVAGGNFTVAGGAACNNIARWDGSWHPLGTGMGGDLFVYALKVYDGELIAGGRFTIAGDEPCNRIARWDGSAWRSLGSGLDGYWPGPSVDALTVHNGELIAGGWCTIAGGQVSAYLARWGCSVAADFDCDGTVGFQDIDLLLAALGGEGAWARKYERLHGTPPPCDYLPSCDANGDGQVDFFDIDAFLALLTRTGSP